MRAAYHQMEKYVLQGGDVNKPNKLGDTPLHEVRLQSSPIAGVLDGSCVRGPGRVDTHTQRQARRMQQSHMNEEVIEVNTYGW